ncbi:MAG TPA: DinB family protein [Acidobacteriota bacterium]|nr:DinB family protein [Acidobacteriota bacterium]
METVLEQILEAWHTNNRINLFLIDKISDEGMQCTLSTRGGRNVVRQFTHVHNLRVWHLEKRAEDLAEKLHKFETQDEPDKKTLKQHLESSAQAIETYFRQVAEGEVKRSCFKKGVIPYLGYFISHESHHRGSILLTLKQSGHKLSQADSYAIWNWDRI